MEFDPIKYLWNKELRQGKLQILYSLDEKGELSIKEISEYTKMSQPLVGFHINGKCTLPDETKTGLGLLGLGLVKKIHNQRDTKKSIAITERGKDVLELIKR